MKLLSLIRRNCKIYFKDKGLFFSSLIAPLILFFLFVAFLGDVYRDSLMSILPEGAKVSSRLVEDGVFYMLPNDYTKEQNGLIKEIDMPLRTEDHSKAINDDLNYLSMKCGFGTERYKFERGQVKTATEVISVNSDMFRTLKKHEIILDDAIKQLIRIVIRLGIVIGEPLNIDSDITIKFDDSIIEDKNAERESDRKDVAMGAMPLEEYRAKWYGETETEAKGNIQEIAEVIE